MTYGKLLLLCSNQFCPRLVVGVILASCLLVGCRQKSPVKTVPVRGTITFNGGAWPSDGMVIFACKEPAAGYPRKSGEAMFGTDGNFVAATFRPKDGLVPGTYLVNLRCIEASAEDITQGTNHVPEKYRRGDTSGFEIVVPADDSKAIEVEFDVVAQSN